MKPNCPWCGMPKNDHTEAWNCGSFPGWDSGTPIQTIACVEIARFKAQAELLREAAGVVRYGINEGRTPQDFWDNYPLAKAMALLPKLEAAIKENE